MFGIMMGSPHRGRLALIFGAALVLGLGMALANGVFS